MYVSHHEGAPSRFLFVGLSPKRDPNERKLLASPGIPRLTFLVASIYSTSNFLAYK